MKLYDELVARGLIAQVTNEEAIREMIDNGKATFYIGFHFLPHHGRVISVLLLDFLDLRLYCLHRFHGTDLFHREGSAL